MKVGAATLQLLVPLCLVSLLLVFNTQARPDLEPEPVVDRQGDPLQPGVRYYVWPIGEEKGGLAWGQTRNQTCPLNVIREPANIIGSPVLFSAPAGLDYIPTLTDLTITMPILGPCLTESRVWRIAGDWVGVYFWFITTGGVAGDLSSKFKIVRREVEEGDHGYEIYSFKFCPSVQWAVCFPVGISVDSDGTQVLAVRPDIEPYYVWFQKVSPTYPDKNQGLSIV